MHVNLKLKFGLLQIQIFKGCYNNINECTLESSYLMANEEMNRVNSTSDSARQEEEARETSSALSIARNR